MRWRGGSLVLAPSVVVVVVVVADVGCLHVTFPTIRR